MYKKLFICIILVAVMVCMTAYATTEGEKVKTIDEVIAETSNETSSTIAESNQFVDNLKEITDFSEPIDGVKPITKNIKSVVAVVVQVLAYVVTAFMALRVLLDLTYITIPFLRTMLSNGYVGNPKAGESRRDNSFLSGSFGDESEGFGGRYGSGSRFGMGGRYGDISGGMYNNTTANRGMKQSLLGRVQWVSYAALNAVANETTIDSDGKTRSPYWMYGKDMLIFLVVTPVLVILAVTGSLASLGFAVGDFLVSAIDKLGGMIK